MNELGWQILSGFTLLVGALGGWFFRHNLLIRNVKKLEKKVNDAMALKMNRDHDSHAARQKLLEKDILIQSLQAEIKELGSQVSEINTLRARNAELESKLENLEKEQYHLLDQVENENAQKLTYQKQTETLNREISRLKNKIKDMTKELKKARMMQESLGAPRRKAYSSKIVKTGSLNKPSSDSSSSTEPTSSLESRTKKSTDKFTAKPKTTVSTKPPMTVSPENKRKKSPKSVSSTGIRLLEKLAEEARNPKPKHSSDKK